MEYIRTTFEAADAKLASTEAEVRGFRLAALEQEKLVDTLAKRLEFQRSLRLEGLGTKMAVMDAEEALGSGRAALASLRADLLRSTAAIATLQREKDVLEKRFIAETSDVSCCLK